MRHSSKKVAESTRVFYSGHVLRPTTDPPVQWGALRSSRWPGVGGRASRAFVGVSVPGKGLMRSSQRLESWKVDLGKLYLGNWKMLLISSQALSATRWKLSVGKKRAQQTDFPSQARAFGICCRVRAAILENEGPIGGVMGPSEKMPRAALRKWNLRSDLKPLWKMT